VRRYLETDAARVARMAYKCRVRDPWYSVPDAQVPGFFFTYMSGLEPNLVRNDTHCQPRMTVIFPPPAPHLGSSARSRRLALAHPSRDPRDLLRSPQIAHRR
jgi:hypothetical protein